MLGGGGGFSSIEMVVGIGMEQRLYFKELVGEMKALMSPIPHHQSLETVQCFLWR